MTVMALFHRTPRRPATERLMEAVALLPPRTLTAMAKAADSRTLRRSLWEDCPIGVTAQLLGHQVYGVGDAATALDIPPTVVRYFVKTWDGLRDPEAHCTAILARVLREAQRTTEKEPELLPV